MSNSSIAAVVRELLAGTTSGRGIPCEARRAVLLAGRAVRVRTQVHVQPEPLPRRCVGSLPPPVRIAAAVRHAVAAAAGASSADLNTAWGAKVPRGVVVARAARGVKWQVCWMSEVRYGGPEEIRWRRPGGVFFVPAAGEKRFLGRLRQIERQQMACRLAGESKRAL